ncbi:tyrosine-type recombinase/integrase [Brucella pituitosa]|uniref:Site-specific integrase n=1 Tax=Brucella pituitosa TaxID=571256 RepID=A0A643EYM9_9HYPH|nr:site-specific integrase [Brucella pituitosa]KAB0570572.1 site-specific integrase [Brucella pituitosa]
MASVRKREWEYNGVRKSAWEVRYVDQGGKHRSKSFDKKKDADAHRSKIETELNAGLHVAESGKFSVEYVAKEYMRWQDQRLKSGIIGKTYHYKVAKDVRRHILPALGHLKLSEVNLEVLSDWHGKLITEKKVAPVSARQFETVLKGIFEFAIRRKWAVRNPLIDLFHETRGAVSKPIATLSTDDIKKLLEAAAMPMYVGRRPRANLLMQCCVHTAAFCGLRLGEILGLKLSNIDMEIGVLKVRSSLSRLDGLKGPKTESGNREVGVPTHVIDLLKAWKASFWMQNKDDLFFTDAKGKPYRHDAIRMLWGGLLYRAGLSTEQRKPTFHFHALRHFAASWRVDAGWALPIVAKEMGHKRVDTTLSVYTHAFEKGMGHAEAAQSLSDRLMPSPKINVPAIAQELRS